MNNKVVIVGGGINGLVAANYLQRNGFQVTLLEKQAQVGGACQAEHLVHDGQTLEYPSGATVLGFMQDFVYDQTGLAKRLQTHTPAHPTVVHFTSLTKPCFLFDEPAALVREVRNKWGETGRLQAYFDDLQRVRKFLIDGYQKATVPTLASARAELGDELTDLWIAGCARDLVDAYFTSEYMKVFTCLDVSESGPVSLASPYSAFTIPLMASGTIFDGSWGFVRGGLPTLLAELSRINQELGVTVLTGASVEAIDEREHTVSYRLAGESHESGWDQLLFASDPVSAAKLIGDHKLQEKVSTQELLGTSGKLVMFFARPIVWKHRTSWADHDSAFKFVIAAESMAALEQTTAQVVPHGAVSVPDYVPGYYELYCDGAADRAMGAAFSYDRLTVYFKHLAFAKTGEQLESVRQQVTTLISGYIENRQDLLTTKLLTPFDLKEKFSLPQGNIDHIELCQGQTFADRTYSRAATADHFYRFGNSEDVFYCAAGSYPCGSIAGTPGYMCASQLLRARRTNRVELVHQ